MTEAEHPVVLFDGECNLCTWSVRFILERDPEGVFRFAPLQSDAGERLLAERGLTGMGTVVLLDEGVHFTKSTAALRILRRLRKPWPLLYAFMFVPRIVRDAVYDWVSRNRFRWFGRRDRCMTPGPEVRERFLGEPYHR